MANRRRLWSAVIFANDDGRVRLHQGDHWPDSAPHFAKGRQSRISLRFRNDQETDCFLNHKTAGR